MHLIKNTVDIEDDRHASLTLQDFFFPLVITESRTVELCAKVLISYVKRVIKLASKRN